MQEPQSRIIRRFNGMSTLDQAWSVASPGLVCAAAILIDAYFGYPDFKLLADVCLPIMCLSFVWSSAIDSTN